MKIQIQIVELIKVKLILLIQIIVELIKQLNHVINHQNIPNSPEIQL